MKKILLSASMLCLLSSASFAGEVHTKSDYPTQARVEYVLQCMNKYGKEDYNKMYGCICAIDKVAEKIPYKNFVATSTLAVMINTPGEKGGIFRDAPGGRKAIRAFKKFISDTERSCGLLMNVAKVEKKKDS